MSSYAEHSAIRIAHDCATGTLARAWGGDEGEWPQEALQAFILRMGEHGMSISRTFMMFDRRYALEQLSYAHTLADTGLRELAMALFRHFEKRRSGLPYAA